MKQVILLISLLIMNTQVSANDDLAAKMQEMSASFRVIGGLMRSDVVTEAHVDAAISLQKATAQAALFFPDSAVEDSAKLQYSRLMLELINAAIDLEEQAGLLVGAEEADLMGLREIITQMSALRRSGHRFFRTR